MVCFPFLFLICYLAASLDAVFASVKFAGSHGKKHHFVHDFINDEIAKLIGDKHLIIKKFTEV